MAKGKGNGNGTGKLGGKGMGGLMERARRLATGGNGDDDGIGDGADTMVQPPERKFKVGDRYLTEQELAKLPIKASDIDRITSTLDRVKTGGRMTPQVQLKALEFALKPDQTQIRSATWLEARHIYYMATSLTWEAIARNDPRPYMEIWATYFMELRRSLDAMTLVAGMRQAGVDTEADALSRMGRMGPL